MPHRSSEGRRRRALPLVLIAEDDDSMRSLVAACLREAGYAVAEAADGAAAVAQARELLPAVILLDLEMPVLDGCMAARALKADPSTSGIPILCFTGSETRADRARALEAGCDGFLDKPATADVVLGAIGRVLGSSARAT